MIVERHRSGDEFGDRAHLHRALIVIFFRQRSKPAAGLVQLAEEDQQVEEIRGRRARSRMTQDAVSNQHDQALGLRQELSGLCPVSPWMAGGGFQDVPGDPVQGGGDALDEARRLLSEGGVYQIPIHHRLEQSEDGVAELLGMGLEVVCGQIRNIAQRIDGRM